jgi:hypothetical protein
LDLSLSPDPGRDEVFDLCGKMREAVLSGDAIRLDAGATQTLSPALAQLIVAAGRSANAAADSGFTLVSPTPQLVDAFQTFGLFADLMTISME